MCEDQHKPGVQAGSVLAGNAGCQKNLWEAEVPAEKEAQNSEHGSWKCVYASYPLSFPPDTETPAPKRFAPSPVSTTMTWQMTNCMAWHTPGS